MKDLCLWRAGCEFTEDFPLAPCRAIVSCVLLIDFLVCCGVVCGNWGGGLKLGTLFK